MIANIDPSSRDETNPAHEIAPLNLTYLSDHLTLIAMQSGPAQNFIKQNEINSHHHGRSNMVRKFS